MDFQAVCQWKLLQILKINYLWEELWIGHQVVSLTDFWGKGQILLNEGTSDQRRLPQLAAAVVSEVTKLWKLKSQDENYREMLLMLNQG